MASTLDGGEHRNKDQNINQYHTAVHQSSHDHIVEQSDQSVTAKPVCPAAPIQTQSPWLWLAKTYMRHSDL
jgi:hypothetical protein